jgi:hypothetical protein
MGSEDERAELVEQLLGGVQSSLFRSPEIEFIEAEDHLRNDINL